VKLVQQEVKRPTTGHVCAPNEDEPSSNEELSGIEIAS